MHSDAKLYYAMLGLPPDATEEAIRNAFRRRAKELHPDSPGGNAGAFIRLKRAYDILNNPTRRANYDRACHRPVRHRLSRDPVNAPPRPRRRSFGVLRYLFATAIMAALSFAFIQALITYSTPPPTGARLAPVGPSLLEPARTATRSPDASRSADDSADADADADADAEANGDTVETPRPHHAPAPLLGAAPAR